MDGLKESEQALVRRCSTNVESFAPPTILAQASRLQFSTRLFNLLVTNIPGPQFPLYLLGQERMHPVSRSRSCRVNQALAVAIMSYDGGMNFGLLGDFDALARTSRRSGWRSPRSWRALVGRWRANRRALG